MERYRRKQGAEDQSPEIEIYVVFKRIQSKIARPASLRAKLVYVATVLSVSVAIGAAPAQANSKYAGIVVDAKTGETLYSNSADSYRYPASLTKMMTLYLVFEALNRGKIKLSTKIPVSANAAAEPPTKLGLKPGQTFTVKQGILGLVTKSANDASTAIGEFLGGSEERFAQMMTRKAHALGMSKTTFRNAHGLTDREQKTTARDMATLGIALREHYPQYYDYFSTRSFTYKGRRMGNHNRLLGRVRGVDGIKTGYTSASGFNLITSVVDRNRSIVAVVMGGRTGASRNAQMKKLIAKYLPRASTRGNGHLVARARPALVAAASIAARKLPEYGPLPIMRSPADTRIALAYAAPSPAQVIGREALAATLRQQQVAIPASGPIPPAPVANVNSVNVDPLTTASTKEYTGWVIQIGATPDRNAALKLLARAKGKAGGTLSNTEAFTTTYEKGSKQLYRARFAGFSGQDSAVAACRSLKKKGFACWATPN